jgi:hypothetical protein
MKFNDPRLYNLFILILFVAMIIVTKLHSDELDICKFKKSEVNISGKGYIIATSEIHSR